MEFERLPTTVKPRNYKVQLQPELEKNNCEGEVTITLDVKETVENIVVNAREISVKSAELQAGDKTERMMVQCETKEERLKFTLKDDKVQPGTYKLKITYSAWLNDRLRGFYATKHTLADGKKRNGALTHFEATGARWAFPCFDEPAIRATFDVTLIVPSDRVALSNMPVESETPHPTLENTKVVQFQTTPLMPTYLVAFVVGDYHKTLCVDKDGVQVRVFTPQGKSEQGIYATKVAATTLPFYKDYFGIAYNLPKLDLVAAPDFAIGAMENWGLVIYRETALLVDPKESSSATRENVALIIGHELAHNWFGNLVTMNWWTHLWLKEGFASWIEYLCVDHCFPQFDIWTQFVSNDLFRALKLDALESSHPIEIEVGNPSEVDEIFDAISYSKGASLINMLHDYIGDDDFRKGLTQYLKRHQYGSACTEDLWKALEEASGKPVGVTMATWTSQKGFPVLKVTEEQMDDQRKLKITQQKFSLTETQSSGSSSSSLWAVPVSILTQSGEVTKVLMEGPTMTVCLTVPPDHWLKVNAGTKGVYRVQYSAEMLTRLIPCLQEQQIGATDRLGIISDLFALAEVGRVSAVDLLNVVKAFQGEVNFTVWKELLVNLSHMMRVLEYSTGATSLFKQFAMALLQPIYAQVGWEEAKDEDHLETRLRSLVIGFLGVRGEKTVVEKALAAFNSHIEGKSSIPSNIRGAVYTIVMAHGTMDHYTKLKKLHGETESAEEKVRIRSSFGCSQDPDVLQDALNFAVSEAVKSQDTPLTIGVISVASAKGRELAWTFFKDNYDKFNQRYSSSLLLARLVKTSTEFFASEEKAAEIEEFFKNHQTPSAERTVQQSCEQIRLNARWLKREAENITKYLTENPLHVSSAEGGSGKPKAKKEKASSKGEGDRLAGIVVELPDQ